MTFETFLHKNEDGEFFICMKSPGAPPSNGWKRDEMLFGPFKTKEQAEEYAVRIKQAIVDEMRERGSK